MNKPPLIIAPDHKLCSTCSLIKPHKLFGLSKNTKDGYRYNCKACQSLANKKFNQTTTKLNLENPPVLPVTKRCSSCQLIKPSSSFGNLISSKDGLQTRCKPCKIIDFQKLKNKPK